MAKLRLAAQNKYSAATMPSDEHHGAQRHPEPKPLLDDHAGLRAVAVEQKSQQIEADAARDERQPEEHPEIVTGKARGDCYNFIRNRREALEQNDPGAPLRIGAAEGIDLIAIAVQLDQPVPDRVDKAARRWHSRACLRQPTYGTDMRVEPGAVGPRQRHRDQHRVRRDRKNRAFQKRDHAHQPGCIGLLGGANAPVVKAAEHVGLA